MIMKMNKYIACDIYSVPTFQSAITKKQVIRAKQSQIA